MGRVSGVLGGGVSIITPLTVSGLGIWIDHSKSGVWQDHTATIPANSDGNHILRIDDLSGNGNYMTATNLSANGPHFTLNVQNGLPAGKFIDYQHYDAGLYGPVWGSAQPLTAIFVFMQNNVQNDGQRIMSGLTEAGFSGILELYISGQESPHLLGTGGMDAGAIIIRKPYVVSVKFNGVLSIIRVNGTQVATGNASTTALGALTIGMKNHGSLWHGYLMEAQFYSADVPTTKLAGLENKLINKWKIRAPKIRFAQIGTVDASTIKLDLSENVSSSDYKTGVTIKVNGSTATISSATRQVNHSCIYYVLSTPVMGTDTVTWEYSGGDYTNEDVSGQDMPTITPTAVQNFVGPSTVIVNDTFTDTNGTLLNAHAISPTNTLGATWIESTGNWTIQSDKANNNTWVRTFGLVETGLANVKITASILTQNGSLNGLIFRYSDASNYWELRRNGSTKALSIYKKVGADGPVVNAVVTTTDVTTQTYTVVCVGDLIMVNDGHGNVLTLEDSFNNTATKHGIVNDIGNIDNFTIYG